jgi:oligopeptidase A
MSLASKMAPDVPTVLSLLEMLREKSMPAAQAELANLKAFAAREGFQGEMALWDIPFWSERLREKQYEFEEEQLRVYFPLDRVLTGLFSLAERLFSVRIVAADGEAQVWNPDVRYFKIYESKPSSPAAGDKPIAAFFLDPYSRPAEKRGGAWMNTCVGRSKVMNQTPVAYLVCNGSPPVDGKPSLMTFREVETLFHGQSHPPPPSTLVSPLLPSAVTATGAHPLVEFGHGLQHMLTKIEHADAAGINNIEWDAVELPSQFMENWCYDKQTLNGFAKHYVTGETIPDELFEKVKAAKNFHAGLAMVRQLYFGMLDLQLHSTYDPSGDKTPFDIQREVATRYSVLPPLSEDRFLCSFSHIFAGGYAAGYYSYKWAEVMSADAFAAFEEVGLENEQAVRETGMRFRNTVLSCGGGKHPSDVFRAFRGKDPTPDALLRHSGLVTEVDESKK